MENNLEILADFNKFIQLSSTHNPHFTCTFPLGNYTDAYDADASRQRVQFVDVGGGNGQVCEAVLQKWPLLRNRVILQNAGNLATQDQVKDCGYSFTAHNFFQPQPLYGARVYYLREVLHDWPDEHCIRILSTLRGALFEDSVILVDDLILSWDRSHWTEAANDLLVMSALAARERTSGQWDKPIVATGLKRESTHFYNDHGRAVQVLVRA